MEPQDLYVLEAYMNGLRTSGANLPSKQAFPMTKLMLLRLLGGLRLATDRAAAIIAWKTASRWGDVQTLTRNNVFRLSPEEIGIDWKGQTKTTREDPHRPDRYVLIKGDLTRALYDILQGMTGTQRLTIMSTADITKHLRRVDLRLSAHSFKHGAAILLTRAAVEGKFRPETVSIMLKHKLMAHLAPKTIRYVQDPATLARLHQTDKATECL
jgi:hypothetical protein